jgi:hypothetical protein
MEANVAGRHAESPELDEIRASFASKGFGLRLVESKNGAVCADLTRLPSDRIVAPTYARGSTEFEAARRAKQRYLEEQ